MSVSRAVRKPVSVIVSQDGTGDYNGATESAIQAAIDYVIANGKGIIVIKKGTYTISNTITVNGHCTIIGEGSESTELRAANSFNNYIMKINSTLGANHYRVKIQGVKFDGNRTNQSADSGGVVGYGIIQSTFENCHFEECYGKGLWLYDTGGGSGNYGHHNQVINCLFDQSEGSAGDGIGLYLRNNDENAIIGSQFQYLNIGLKDETGFNQIIGCSFVDGRDGLYLLDCWRTRVSNCIFDTCGRRGAWIKGYRNSLLGCTFYKCSDGNSGTYPCVDIEWYGSNVISACVFNSHETNGMTRSYIKETSPTDSTKGYNVVTGCRFTQLGTLGTSELEFSETTNTIFANCGLASTEQTYIDKAGNQYTLRDAWTHLTKITLSAASAEQSYTLPSGYDIFEILFRIKKSTSTGSGTFGMRLNSATSGYKQNNIAYATPANPNTTAFKFCAGGTGAEKIAGHVTLFKKGIDTGYSVHVVGTAYAGDQFVWLGGRNEIAGDVTAIKFDDYDSDSTFDGEIIVRGIKAA